jgi:hypothetical protein
MGVIYEKLDVGRPKIFRNKVAGSVKRNTITRLGGDCCDNYLKNTYQQTKYSSYDFDKSELFRHDLVQNLLQFIA